MKIAIVQDWMFTGGAEKVIESLHRLYPSAPIYTALSTNEWKQRLDNQVVTGVMDRWPLNKVCNFLPLFQQAWFASIDFSAYDIIISSSGNGAARFANYKHAKKRNRQPLHIAYTLTPTHYYWGKYNQYIKDPGFRPKWLMRLGLRILVGHLRKNDYKAAQKADSLIAISSHIKSDIKTYYDRESEVIWPPVDTNRFKDIQRSRKPSPYSFPFYIIWGRHVPYKRFDIAIDACNLLRMHLVVVGDGPDSSRLKQHSGPTIHFVGRASDEEINTLARHARGFLSPQVEDFGIAPVEAMSAGLPVLAFKAGGALDYVVEGKTGVFFDEQTPESMATALKKFDTMKFDAQKITDFAQSFGEERFREEMDAYVTRAFEAGTKKKA